MELHSISSVHSEPGQNQNKGNHDTHVSNRNNTNSNDLPENFRSAKDVSVHSCSDSPSSSASDGISASTDTFSASTSHSSTVHRVLNKRDGESVEQLVQRILNEAKHNGRLSEEAAALLKRQSLSSTVASGLRNAVHTDDDLLPSAKLALAASKAVIDSAGALSPKPTVLSTSAQSFLDQRNIADEAVQIAVQRVQGRRYPFPVRDDGMASSGRAQLLSTKLNSLQDQATDIAQGLRRQRSPSPPKFPSASTDEHLAEHIDQLVKNLHQCVLQRTMKEAQLRLLRGEDPASVASR
jgi:hypothetical protein